LNHFVKRIEIVELGQQHASCCHKTDKDDNEDGGKNSEIFEHLDDDIDEWAEGSGGFHENEKSHPCKRHNDSKHQHNKVLLIHGIPSQNSNRVF